MNIESSISYHSKSDEHPTVIQCEIHRDDLSQALSLVAVALVDTELDWIQIKFLGENAVEISAVNHQLSVKTLLNAKHEGKGTIKISGKQITEYVRQLPSEKISLTVDANHRLLLTCARSNARLQLIQDEADTDIQIPLQGTSIQVQGNLLQKWVDSFKDFVQVDDTRHYANGAYIGLNPEGHLSSVATDSLRLAKADLETGFEIVNKDESFVLVPRKTLDELHKISGIHPDEKFTLHWSQENLFFALETKNYVLISKCVAGAFPPYSAAIPQAINLSVSLDLRKLSESIKRMLLLADKGRTVSLKFNHQTLLLQSFTPGLKEGEEYLELEDSVKESFEVYFNGHLLQSILNSIVGPKIVFSWQDVKRPVKVEGNKESGLSVFYLLVPTRY